MNVQVTTELHTRPEHAQTLVDALRSALPHSLEHDRCEAIHLRCDQGDPTRLVSSTQWASRRNYEKYLAWRTETGMIDEIDELPGAADHRMIRRHRQ
jgi:quinol monooxygenase YgiN